MVRPHVLQLMHYAGDELLIADRVIRLISGYEPEVYGLDVPQPVMQEACTPRFLKLLELMRQQARPLTLTLLPHPHPPPSPLHPHPSPSPSTP